MRSSHLCDLLNCVSSGASLCLHPWLLGNFEEATQWLAQDRQPAYSPPLLLRFDSPASLLRLQCEDGANALSSSSSSSSPLSLLTGLTRASVAPRSVCARLVELLPDVATLKHALLVDDGSPATKRPRLNQAEQATTPFLTQEIYEAVRLEERKALNKG